MFTSARFCLFLLVSTVALSAAAVPRQRRDTAAATGPVSNLTIGTGNLLEQLVAAYTLILNGFPFIGPTLAGVINAANPGGLVKTVGGTVDTLTNPLIGTLGGLPGIIPGAVKATGVTGATGATAAPVTTTAASA